MIDCNESMMFETCEEKTCINEWNKFVQVQQEFRNYVFHNASADVLFILYMHERIICSIHIVFDESFVHPKEQSGPY